jgi:hypothetical protein
MRGSGSPRELRGGRELRPISLVLDPDFSSPVNELARRIAAAPFPPDVAILGQGDIRKMVYLLNVRMAFGSESIDVPGATPKNPDSGFMA